MKSYQQLINSFDMSRAISQVGQFDGVKDGAEFEFMREFGLKSERNCIYVPFDVIARNASDNTASVVAPMAQKPVEFSSMMDLLLPRSVMSALNIRTIPAVGHPRIPVSKKSAADSADFVVEDEDFPEDGYVFEDVLFEPHGFGVATSVSASASISPQLMQFICTDLIRRGKSKLERIIFGGAKTADETFGSDLLSQLTNSVTVDSWNDTAQLAKLIGTLVDSGIDPLALRFLMGGVQKGVFQTTPVIAGGSVPLLGNDGRIFSTPAVSSALSNPSKVVLGDFYGCVMASWGVAAKIMVDQFSYPSSGQVVYRMLDAIDFKVTNPECFTEISLKPAS